MPCGFCSRTSPKSHTGDTKESSPHPLDTRLGSEPVVWGLLMSRSKLEIRSLLTLPTGAQLPGLAGSLGLTLTRGSWLQRSLAVCIHLDLRPGTALVSCEVQCMCWSCNFLGSCSHSGPLFSQHHRRAHSGLPAEALPSGAPRTGHPFRQVRGLPQLRPAAHQGRGGGQCLPGHILGLGWGAAGLCSQDLSVAHRS